MRLVPQVALAIGLLVVGTVLLSVGLGLYLSGKQEQGGEQGCFDWKAIRVSQRSASDWI